MALKVYGMKMSTNTARVLSCVYEIGVDVELVPVNIAAGDHKKPEYLTAKNPFGQIPALEDGDLTLFDSRAINRYLSTKYKDQGTDLLRSGDIKEAALVNVWLEVESQTYNPPISSIVFQYLVKPKFGGSPDSELIESDAKKLEKVLDIYEQRLSSCKYLAGDFFSLADLNHIVYTVYFMKTPKAVLVNSRPHVKAWWEDVSSRPSIKKVAEGMTLA